MTGKIHTALCYLKYFLLAKRKGHGVHSPFAYRLCEDVFYNELPFYDFKKLDAIRDELLQNQQVLEITDLGAGSRTLRQKRRKISDIAANGISQKKQSEILYRLINYLNCRHGVEVGTSLGLNTLYLSLANPSAQFFSLEGSPALLKFAEDLASQHQRKNIRFVGGNFDDSLPEVLKEMPALDFIYFDGNHTYEATMRYFNLALPYRNSNSVFILDDIYWSPGMTRAWKEIKKHEAVKMSLDLFSMGILFFREEIKEKVELQLFI